MRRLNRVAAGLAGSINAMSILLMVVLAGSASLAWSTLPAPVAKLGRILAFGAAVAWPLFALVAAGMLALLALGAWRPALQSPRRGAALLLGAVALHAAWLMGIRPPSARPVVLTGLYAHGSIALRGDFLVPCADPARPLPRGAELALRPRSREIPLIVAVPVPEQGWHGSHPRRWPDTRSDPHGGQYWLVRVRGRLVGPGHYGWPPIAHYRLDVDSVLSVAPDRVYQDECGVHSPPPRRPRE